MKTSGPPVVWTREQFTLVDGGAVNNSITSRSMVKLRLVFSTCNSSDMNFTGVDYSTALNC